MCITCKVVEGMPISNIGEEPLGHRLNRHESRLDICYQTYGWFTLVQQLKKGEKCSIDDYLDILDIKLEYMPEIIDSYRSNCIKSGFEPFYRNFFDAWMITKSVDAYFVTDYDRVEKKGILLENRRSTCLSRIPSQNVSQLFLTVEELEQVYNYCKNYSPFSEEIKIDATGPTIPNIDLSKCDIPKEIKIIKE